MVAAVRLRSCRCHPEVPLSDAAPFEISTSCQADRCLSRSENETVCSRFFPARQIAQKCDCGCGEREVLSSWAASRGLNGGLSPHLVRPRDLAISWSKPPRDGPPWRSMKRIAGRKSRSASSRRLASGAGYSSEDRFSNSASVKTPGFSCRLWIILTQGHAW